MFSRHCAPNRLDELTKLATAAAQSNTRGTLDDLAVDRINQMKAAHKKKREVIITASITEDEFSVLEEIFPECNLRLEIRSNNSHGIAAAARQCEYEILLIRSNAGKSRVVDAGGNCPIYLRRMIRVHSCRPILSLRDAQRIVKMIEVIVRILRSDTATDAQKEKARECMLAVPPAFRPQLDPPLPDAPIRPNDYLCTKSCQCCDVPADTIITCHSAYDFDIYQQCEAMISHGASTLHGSFLFEPAMMVNHVGFSPFLRYEWNIQKLKCADQHPLGGSPCLVCSGHKIIDYSFRDDASFCYRHDFANIELMVRTTHQVIQGQTFVLEFHENRRGIQFYEITRIPGIYIPPSHLSRRLHFSSLAETSFVRVFHYNDFGHNKDDRMYTRIEAFPETIVTQARRYVSTHKDAGCTIQDLVTYISAADSVVAVAGAYVSYRHNLTAQQIRDLSTSVFIENIFQRVSQHHNIRQAQDHHATYDAICEAKWFELNAWKTLFSEVFSKFKRWLFGSFDHAQKSVGEDVRSPTPGFMTRLILGVRDYSDLLPAFHTFSKPLTIEQFFTGRKSPVLCARAAARFPTMPDHPDAVFVNSALASAPRHPELIPTSSSIRIRNCVNCYLTSYRDVSFFHYVCNYSDSYGSLASEVLDHYFYYTEVLPKHLVHGQITFYNSAPPRSFVVDFSALRTLFYEFRVKGSAKASYHDANLIDIITVEFERLYHVGDFKNLFKAMFTADDFMNTCTTGCNLLNRIELPWLKRNEFWRYLITQLPATEQASAQLMAQVFGVNVNSIHFHNMISQNYSLLDQLRSGFFQNGAAQYPAYRASWSFPRALLKHIQAHTHVAVHKHWCQALELWATIRGNGVVPQTGLILNDRLGHFADLFDLAAGFHFDTINDISANRLQTGLSALSTLFSRTIFTRDVANAVTGAYYDLVISNTVTDRGISISDREEKHVTALVAASQQIDQCLHVGGTAILRLYSVRGNMTQQVIYDLMCHFERCQFVRLRTSCQTSTEKFLILYDYLGPAVRAVDFKHQIIDLEDAFSHDLYEYTREFYAGYPNRPPPDFYNQISDWLYIFQAHLPKPLVSTASASPAVVPPTLAPPGSSTGNPPAGPPSSNIPTVTDDSPPPSGDSSVSTSTDSSPPVSAVAAPVPTGIPPPADPADTYIVSRYADMLPVQNIPAYIKYLQTNPYLGHHEIDVLNQLHGTRVNCMFHEVADFGRIIIREFIHSNLSADQTIYVYDAHAYIANDIDKYAHVTKFFRPYSAGLMGLRSMPGDGDCILHAYLAHTGLALTPKELRAEIIEYWQKASATVLHVAGGSNLDSLLELREYWSLEMKHNTEKAASDWSKTVQNPKRLRRSYANAQYEIDGVVYLRLRSNGTYTPFYKDHRDLAVSYEYGFDGKQLIPLKCKDGVITADSDAKLIYVSRFTVLIQGPRLYKSTANYKYSSSNVVMQAGIAGAGKTYAIVKSCTNSDLILTALRESAEETRAKIAAAHKTTVVKTVDSYLINDRGQYDNVYYDEAFSVHAGYVGLITSYAQCQNVYCYGDPNQVPAISRVAGFLFKNNRIHANVENFECVSKRCPADVCRAVNRLYLKLSGGRTIMTRNPKLVSMKIKRIANVSSVPTSGFDVVTWTQAEKKALIGRFPNVKTIHEKQGATVRNLALVRSNHKSLPLYKSTQHAISAITRHTNSFTYFTVTDDKDDAVIRLIRDAPKVSVFKFRDDDLFPEDFDRRAGAIGFVETVEKPRILYDARGAAITDRYYRANQHLPTAARTTGRHRRQYKNLSPQPIYAAAVAPRVSDALKTAQQSYDAAMPIPVDYTEDYLGKSVEDGDISIYPTNLRWKRGKSKLTAHTSYMEKFDIRSHARTAQPYPRFKSEKTTLLAVNKRNMNSYHDCAPSDPDELAAHVVETVMDSIGVPDWRERSAFYKANPVRLSREALDEYLITAGSKDWHMFEKELTAHDPVSITPEVLSKYECMIKDEPKNRLSPDVLGEYQALQTIIHHKSFVNLVMSIFREITIRLLEIMDPRVCIQIKKSPKDLEDHVNSYVKVLLFLLYEIDFSKFDKSQFWEALRIEMAVYSMLGLDALIAQLWNDGFTEKQVRVVQFAIMFTLYLQRTSGTVTTGLGNLIVNLFTNVFSMKLKRGDYHAITAVGDDSAFFLKHMLEVEEVTHSLYSYFNLEAKVLTGLGCYFCSSFFVYSGDRWLLMPDPIKKFERLSIPLRSTAKETLHDRWNSLRDLCKNYYDASAVDSLDFQCQLRYGYGSIKGIVNAITTIMDDYDVFLSLFRE